MGKIHRVFYESPCMECIQIQAESDFMSGSVFIDKKSKVEIKGHEIGNTYDFDDKPSEEGGFNYEWKD